MSAVANSPRHRVLVRVLVKLREAVLGRPDGAYLSADRELFLPRQCNETLPISIPSSGGPRHFPSHSYNKWEIECCCRAAAMHGARFHLWSELRAKRTKCQSRERKQSCFPHDALPPAL